MKFDEIVAKLAVAAVLASFALLPLGIWAYDGFYVRSQHPEGSQIFTLYFSGQKGITQKRINGLNYWRPKFEPVKELQVREGDRVVFRLISADVQHGFAVPPWISDGVVKPGDLTTIEFVADQVGSFEFFCTMQCGPMHEQMQAVLTVLPANARTAGVGVQ